MPTCSFCAQSTDPHPYHSWGLHCLDALRKALAAEQAKNAAYQLLAEHYEALECEVDRLEGEKAEAIIQRDTSRAIAADRQREISRLMVRLAQAEATAECGG